jgi:hypothetical protein
MRFTIHCLRHAESLGNTILGAAIDSDGSPLDWISRRMRDASVLIVQADSVTRLLEKFIVAMHAVDGKKSVR